MQFDTNPDFESRRSAVVGRGGMVATSQPLAVAAGLELLRAGEDRKSAVEGKSVDLGGRRITKTSSDGD